MHILTHVQEVMYKHRRMINLQDLERSNNDATNSFLGSTSRKKLHEELFMRDYRMVLNPVVVKLARHTCHICTARYHKKGNLMNHLKDKHNF